MENEDYPKTNREKKLQPKQGVYWCNSCDRQLVVVGAKCKTCGAIEKRTIKKESSA